MIHHAGDEGSRRDAMQSEVRRDRLRVFFLLRPGVFLRVSDDASGPVPPPISYLYTQVGWGWLCELSPRTQSRERERERKTDTRNRDGYRCCACLDTRGGVRHARYRGQVDVDSVFTLQAGRSINAGLCCRDL
jgi:hypothetical protein